jgi:hypothetical protein
MLHGRPNAVAMINAADCKMQNSFDAVVSGFNGSLHELRALSMLRLEGKTIHETGEYSESKRDKAYSREVWPL